MLYFSNIYYAFFERIYLSRLICSYCLLGVLNIENIVLLDVVNSTFTDNSAIDGGSFH
jgi:hypothetical protein